MSRWLRRALKHIRERALARKVRFTLKARRELAALDVEMDEEDACDVIAHLAPEDSAGRFESAPTGEWMYVFKPSVGGTTLYVKIVLRDDCIAVSFHEDEGGGHDEEEP